MLAQPSEGVHDASVISLIIAAVSPVIAFIFAFKGRLYREDEVKPVYAEHLAERISMQAEVSAAREAQTRLIPERLPNRVMIKVASARLESSPLCFIRKKSGEDSRRSIRYRDFGHGYCKQSRTSN